MPRPRLKESFLKQAFKLSKKGTKIFYYDFSKASEVKKIKEKIEIEAKKAHKKIKFLGTKKAGEIAPYKIRIRIDFKVL
jgi:tRNA G37 N-methylase Trm5